MLPLLPSYRTCFKSNYTAVNTVESNNLLILLNCWKSLILIYNPRTLLCHFYLKPLITISLQWNQPKHTPLFEASGTIIYKTPTSNTFPITSHHSSILSTHPIILLMIQDTYPYCVIRPLLIPETTPHLKLFVITLHDIPPFTQHSQYALHLSHFHHHYFPLNLLPHSSHHSYAISGTRRALLTTLGPLGLLHYS